MADERNPTSELTSEPIKLEERTESTFTDTDLADLDRFTNEELDAFERLSNDRTSVQYQDLGSAGFVHVFAYNEVNRGRMKKTPLSIFLARNDKGRLVGYSVVSLDPQEADPSKKVTASL